MIDTEPEKRGGIASWHPWDQKYPTCVCLRTDGNNEQTGYVSFAGVGPCLIMALSRYIPLHLDTEPECPIRRTGSKGAGTTFECEETLFRQPGFFFCPGPWARDRPYRFLHLGASAVVISHVFFGGSCRQFNH